MQGYLATSPQATALVGEGPQRDELLSFFLLDRALRELDGELHNRPDWVGIPLDRHPRTARSHSSGRRA